MKIKLFKKKINILNEIDNKNLGIRFFFFCFACFIYALTYNTFLVPNSIVTGGMSGLAIVIKELTGLSTTYFIYCSTTILVIISYIILGKDKVFYTLFGSLVYTLTVSFTEPLSKYFVGQINNDFLMILICSLLIGFANGIIYRSGFNTGGSDVLSAVLNKYLKIPIGKCNAIINIFIILTGTYLFGPIKTIYAVFILTISSKLIDVVMLGINDSKMIYIKSHKWKELEEFLLNEVKVGVTEIGNKGGIFINKEPTLLVIVPFDLYFNIKHQILEIDKKAFLSVHDCYAVQNGYNKKLLPF